jgi:hypothetical protein
VMGGRGRRRGATGVEEEEGEGWRLFLNLFEKEQEQRSQRAEKAFNSKYKC